MVTLKFHPGPPLPTLLRPSGRPPLKWPHGSFWVAYPQDGRLAAVFYPFGHPTPMSVFIVFTALLELICIVQIVLLIFYMKILN
jgi:hypothetical protein